MNFQQSVDYLYSFVDFERTTAFTYDTRTFDLEAFLELLAQVKSPQSNFDIIHVAGTKGKGSTCAMLASVLKSSRRKVGLFTSPHLLNVRERVQVDGEWISEDTFASILSEIEPVQTRLGVRMHSYRTTFELLTAIALMHFAQQGVDVAVLETGLGGRLDATNVVSPTLCIITRIGYDHTAVLGEDISSIAAEKAGIIKERTPVVIGPQLPEVLRVIMGVARSKGSATVDVAREFSCDSKPADDCRGIPLQILSIEGNGLRIDDIRLPLLGAHQIENACCVVAASRILARELSGIDAGSIRQGLSQVRLMGRVEVLKRNPWLILDCAHNPESAEALVNTLREVCAPVRKIAIVGLSANKDAQTMLAVLTRYFDRFLVTKADTKRAFPPAQLADILRGFGAKVDVFLSAAGAAAAGLSMLGPDDMLCVTGSFYLAGELRHILVDQASAPIIASGLRLSRLGSTDDR